MPKKIKKGKRKRQVNLVGNARAAILELCVQASRIWGAAYAEDPTTRDAIFSPVQQPMGSGNRQIAWAVGMSPPVEVDADGAPEFPEVRTHTRLAPELARERGRCTWHPRHSAWLACTTVPGWIDEAQQRYPLGVYYCTAGMTVIESETGRTAGGIYVPDGFENKREMPVAVCTYAGMFGVAVAVAEIPALLHTETARASDIVAARVIYDQAVEPEENVDPRVWALPNSGVQWVEAETGLRELGLLSFVPDFGLFLPEEEVTPEELEVADAELAVYFVLC